MDSSEISPSDRKEEQPAAPLPLPAAFLEFLGENGLDPMLYSMADTIPRYIRLKPGTESRMVTEVETELKCDLAKVSWLPDFYAIPPEIQIAGSKAYQQGKIYGIDAASGAAILALDVQPGDHVLDLCAAPGAKLCMLADMLGSTGSLTGVDVAKHRLAACRTMLQKYSLGDRSRLFVADGTSFSILPVNSNLGSMDGYIGTEDSRSIFSQWTSKRSWKERQKSKKAKAAGSPHPPSTSEPELIYYGKDSGVVGLQKHHVLRQSTDDAACTSGYDKVLVDAECTHDGSIKHIQKFEFWGWKTLDRRVLEAERTGNLLHLQLGLLRNGFKLLKTGGSLVYSTCSLTVAQNENVVQQFLSQCSSAELLKIDSADSWPCRSGSIEKTLRFDPATSQTSGLFVSKFVKLPS
ncbi:rRNA (cytosine-C(5))-methyltransferase NOP2C-like [Lolium rigidum]|uniref:rRNA (cytosine-C(5))-methyltransferase NOP2C-like n=1 Tax=Lolium rigidum TaxID=89674 RepID=UPI001F5D01A6|nr:rRNA (cytosine-C(5))-methyltransferase NOP2C-like [Lolium rigidum]